jgi:trimeric autotransporter adhesin
MVKKRTCAYCGSLTAAGLAVAGFLLASQHQGVVKSGPLAIPGATVVATQGDKKLITTTDGNGAYSFADIPDGAWTVQVDMLGFEQGKRAIEVAPGTPSAQWDLRFLSESELLGTLAPQPAPAASPTTPAAPAAPNAKAAAVPPTATSSPARGGRGGRNRQSNAGQTFQQVGVNQASETSLFSQEGVITTEMNAELSPSANQAFVVQGSMSSALGIEGQNDWGGFGRGGPDGPGMMGMGGPGMPGMGPNGEIAGGDQMPGVGGGDIAGGGRGGAGGDMAMAVGGRGGGGMPGGGGPGGGGMPGGGGPGGGGMPGGRGGGGRGGDIGSGRGGRGGAPAWMGRGNAMAFGNNRRNPRQTYNGNLSINEANSLLNAQDYSLSGQNIPKPYSNNPNISGSFGGPLKIPKLLSGDRGQFTINVGIGRSRKGQQGSLSTMPSDLERSGDFSQSVGASGTVPVIYDPTTGAPFPGNKIDPTRISSIAAALLKYYPSPNLPGQTRNFQLPTTSHSNTQNLNLRLNQTLTTRNRISGGLGYSSNSSITPSIFGFTDTGSGRGMNANASYTHNFTSRMIATLNYTFSRNRRLSSPFFANKTNIAALLGIQGVSTDPLNWGPPNLSFTNFAGLSDVTASLSRSQSSSVGGSLTWVHKTHNLSFGSTFQRQQTNNNSDSNGRGTFTFNGYATSAIVDGAALTGTGFDLADFLLGTPDVATVRYGTPSLYFRGSLFNVYMQDDWRLNPRISLTFGVRWEYQSPVTELYNRIVNLDVAPNFTAISAVQPGQTGALTGQQYSSAMVNSDPNNISPRLGIAWRPSSKRSTVFRAGYGLYYNSSVYSNVASQMSQQPPLATAWNLNIQNSPLLSMGDAFTNPANIRTNTLTTNTFAVDPNWRIGYVHQWNFSIQQNLPYSFQTNITYQGSKGTNLVRQFQPWVTPPNASKAGYPTGYTYETYGGNSNFNGVSVSLMRRFRGGLSANGSYTFSKSIDDGGAGVGGSRAQDWLNFRAERALSSFDQRHSLNINFSYSTGQGRRGAGLVTGWKGQLVKDWSIQSAIQVRNSNPMTATVGGNQASSGATSQTLRADATGIALNAVTAGTILNPAAFAVPAAGFWGNAGRDTIPGPMVVSLNGSAGRVFRLGERRSVDLQIRANNALNTVVINRWNTQLNNNTFGLPTGVGDMRSVTTSLRFRF